MNPRKFLCPSCGVGLKVAATVSAGKKINCPKCGATFGVPAGGEPEPEPIEIEAEAPARSRKAAPPPDDADDEDFDQEPEERPAPRKRKKKKKPAASNLPLVLGLSIGGGVLLLGAVVALAVFRPWERKTEPTVVANNPGKPRPGEPREREREVDLNPRAKDKNPGGGGEGQFASAGKSVYDKQDCSRCHAVGGGGGQKKGRGPNLSRVGANRTAEWISEHVRDPKSHRPTSRMPGYADKLSREDLRSLGEYLASLK